MNNLNLGKKMVLITILINLFKVFFYLTATIVAAILMMLFLKGNESNGALYTKIMITALILPLKARSLYKKSFTIDERFALNYKLAIIYVVDVIFMMLLFFIAPQHVVIYLIIILGWFLYAIIRGVMSYQSMGAINLNGLNMDEQFLNGLLNSANSYPDLLESQSLAESEEHISEDGHDLEIDSMEDDDLIEELHQYVNKKVGNRTGQNEEMLLREIDQTFCLVYLIEELNRAVNDDGFTNYFHTPCGYFAYETLRCLDEIGADKAHEILKEAIDLLNDDNIDLYKNKQLSWELGQSEYSKELEDLSTRYKKECDKVYELIINFVRNEYN